jgi:hypothetical protein
VVMQKGLPGCSTSPCMQYVRVTRQLQQLQVADRHP